MANGKPGDHPLTDIVVHGRRVYSDRADDLVRRIVRLGGRANIEGLLLSEYNEYENPDVPKLELVLAGIHDRLLADARGRGWEIDE
jgi:hypothetical protein